MQQLLLGMVTPLCGNLLAYPVLHGSLRKSGKKKTCQQIKVKEMNRFINYYKKCSKRNMLEVDSFVGFFHHPVMTMHLYRHPLFKSGYVLYTDKI